LKPSRCPAVAVIAVFLAAIPIGAQSPASKSDIAQLTTLACEMGQAYARQDLAALDRLNADDYTQTDTRGVVVSHAEYPEYVKQRTAAFVSKGVSAISIACDNIEVRIYRDAAVVTGGWTYTMQKPEGNTSRRSRWTSVWTRYPDGWKRHAFQNTWVDVDANQTKSNSSH
jgi:ketosteroid isomerase-like protein